MLLQTLTINNSSIEEFIHFWSGQYNYPLDDLYQNNIELKSMEPENLMNLFLWKNGMRLSNNKETGFNKIVQHINVINELKEDFNSNKFEQYFGNVSSIWQIFLKHIINPEEYPIFDQHVYRAYRFINGLPEEPLPENSSAKLEIYDLLYRPFYQAIQKEAVGFSSKVIDEALWANGKFLSNYSRMFHN